MRFAEFRATRYFPALDGLRALSICAVIWHHATPEQLSGVAGRGHLGVRLFFALSGFLITTLLLREKQSTGSLALGRFWLRRSLRLFPLYYAVLALFVAYAFSLPIDAAQRLHFFDSLPFYATHTANWFVHFGVTHPILFAFAWSLSTEEQFYLLWPPLIKWLPRRGWLVLALLALIVLDQLLERDLLPWAIPRLSLPGIIVRSFVASIGFGALLAIGLDDARGFRWLSRGLGHAFSLPVCVLLVATGVAWPPHMFVFFELALAALVASAVLCPQHALARALGSAPLRHVGRVSYGMYLFHVPIIGALRRVFPMWAHDALFLFALGLPLSVLLASASHRWFEAWFLKLRPAGRK
jgi:peptidoglycan/LPS O-acetylase OafA/YrhL